MKLFIDSSQRYLRRVTLNDYQGKVLAVAQGQEEMIKLIDEVLKKAGVKLSSLTEISAKMEGESRVGINVGVAAANALNYALGLKKVKELTFPTDPNDKFR